MAPYALVAEADLEDAGLIRHLISSEGVELQMVRDGHSALEVMKKRGPPSLLVTDLSLPLLDGFQLIAELRKISDEQASPVVALSAFHGLRTVAARMKDQLGLTAVLGKPIALDALRRAIKRALAQNFSMRSSTPGYQLPPPVSASNKTQTKFDLATLEKERGVAVQKMGLVDDLPPDVDLSQLLAEAAHKLGVEGAFVSLALADRHWFKAHAGLTGQLLKDREVRRGFSLCEHVIETRALLVVPDATLHPLFAEEPVVKSGEVRGFAAAPLTGPGGETLGALCLVDSRPLPLSPDGLDALVWLSRRISGELELRAAKQRSEAANGDTEEQIPATGNSRVYLEAVLENIDEGVYLLGSDRRVAFINRALAGWLGKVPDDLRGSTSEQLLVLAGKLFDDPAAFARRVRVPETGPFLIREELVAQRPQRRVLRWVAKPVQLPEGIGHLGMISDITAESDLAHEREVLARTDPLTGLANRRGGEEAIEREVARSERSGSRLSFALIDVDKLKGINDGHGHSAGDDALRAVGRVLLASVRGGDLVVRWGGDEFLCVLPQTGLEGALSLGERARAGIEAGTDTKFKVTISCGVAELHQGEDEGVALARADEQLYAAKHSGGNLVK
jgi:diguanylate cyclase (GGDEF)-like protein